MFSSSVGVICVAGKLTAMESTVRKTPATKKKLSNKKTTLIIEVKSTSRTASLECWVSDLTKGLLFLLDIINTYKASLSSLGNHNTSLIPTFANSSIKSITSCNVTSSLAINSTYWKPVSAANASPSLNEYC